jgi:hypothetical protein
MVLKSNGNEESNQRKLSKTCHRTHIFFTQRDTHSPSVKIYCAFLSVKIYCAFMQHPYVCIVWNDWIGWFCNWELPESSPNQASVIQENPQLTYMGPPPVVECLQVVDVKAASSFFTWGWPKVNQIDATCHSNHKIAKLFFKSKEPL